MTIKHLNKLDDLVGGVFGELTVISFYGVIENHRVFDCRCSCGNVKTIRGSRIRLGTTTSCGCNRGSLKTHGMSRTPTHTSWRSMKDRCNAKKGRKFLNYGSRGITYCDRWGKFINFLEDMGERPKGTTLDRINNDGNYEPSNCKWSTPKQQANNRRAYGTNK